MSDVPENTDGMFTASEVAALFKVNVKTVYAWIKRGRLPVVRTPFGGIRISGDTVQSLLNGDFDSRP